MNPPYTQELAIIRDWINDRDRQLFRNEQIIISQTERNQIIGTIQAIAKGIQHEYPFYCQELLAIQNKLFCNSPFVYGAYTIKIAVFGQLYIIIKHINIEPLNQRLWQDIHPSISKVSKDLFCDGHFPAAAEAAIKEVESQMRAFHKQFKPTAVPPKDAISLIGVLLSENGPYALCDSLDISSKNYRKGIHQIFEGTFSAYRNPNMHQNLPCSQREAFERITLASLMMYILTEGRANQ